VERQKFYSKFYYERSHQVEWDVGYISRNREIRNV
jgi:hypothetical protein